MKTVTFKVTVFVYVWRLPLFVPLSSGVQALHSGFGRASFVHPSY